MNRCFSGAAVAALLLTPLAPTTAAPAAMPSASQADTLTLHREYGQGAVKIPVAVTRVLLTFHGRKGDKVLLE